MLKILQARLQQYMNRELADIQAGFKKGRGTRDQIANICWITEKEREFQKNIYFRFTDYAEAFGCVKVKVAQFCPTLCDPIDCSTPSLPLHYHSQSLLRLLSIELEMPSNHLILCRPLLLLPSIFSSIRVFSLM